MAYGFSDNKRLCKVDPVFSCVKNGVGSVTFPQIIRSSEALPETKRLCTIRYDDLYAFLESNARQYVYSIDDELAAVMAEIHFSPSVGEGEKVNVLTLYTGLGVDKNTKRIMYRGTTLDPRSSSSQNKHLSNALTFEVEECTLASRRVSVYFGSIKMSAEEVNGVEYINFSFGKESYSTPNPYKVRYKNSGAEYEYNATNLYNNLVFHDIRFITT